MPEDVQVERNASQYINLTFGNLLNFLPPTYRTLIRNLEKKEKKIIDSKYGIKFTEMSQSEQLRFIFFLYCMTYTMKSLLFKYGYR